MQYTKEIREMINIIVKILNYAVTTCTDGNDINNIFESLINNKDSYKHLFTYLFRNFDIDDSFTQMLIHCANNNRIVITQEKHPIDLHIPLIKGPAAYYKINLKEHRTLILVISSGKPYIIALMASRSCAPLAISHKSAAHFYAQFASLKQ